MDITFIIKTIGRQVLIERLGVVPSAVSNAERSGRFPASWYSVVRDECAIHNIDVCESLFNFKDAK